MENLSQRFDISRGCRQGDPIAPYLFLIAVEFLAHKLRNNVQIKGFNFGQNTSHMMDLYADDLTIYLAPDDQSLKTVIETLKSFYKLSCLKININKTKAVWFGSAAGSDMTLCPDEGLDWTDTFTLLGIQFDSKLEKMEVNYATKLEEIRKLLHSWQFRYLTPYGKIVILKSLALSKLSHIALVVPNIKRKDIKNLERVFLDFLWSDKNARICHSDIYYPLKQGGLNMVDVETFWLSLKCSWLRRLLRSNAFWPNILSKNLEKNGYETLDIFIEGPYVLKAIAGKISNEFWKNVLLAAARLVTEACNQYVNDFHLFPVFGNPLFRNNERMLYRKQFKNIPKNISVVSDFFKEKDTAYTTYEIKSLYKLNLHPTQFNNIINSIQEASNKLVSHKSVWHQTPRQSLLVKICTRQVRGCRTFYDILRAKHNKHTTLRKYEIKWNTKLNLSLPVAFWEGVWYLHSSLQYNNQFKWLQCQILRYCLYTNNRVSKFKPEVSGLCDFCNLHDENPMTLFWECTVTQEFWGQVRLFIAGHTHHLPDSKLGVLFGFTRESWDSLNNTIIMIGKQVIWNSKVKKQTPTLIQFKRLLKYYLMLLEYCSKIDSVRCTFDQQWDSIISELNQDDADISGSNEQ